MFQQVFFVQISGILHLPKGHIRAIRRLFLIQVHLTVEILNINQEGNIIVHAQVKHFLDRIELYRVYWSYKYGENAPKTLSKSSRGGTIMAWNKMESVWYKTLDEVGLQELQEILNRVAKKYSKSTVEKVKTTDKGAV